MSESLKTTPTPSKNGSLGIKGDSYAIFSVFSELISRKITFQLQDFLGGELISEKYISRNHL